MTIREELLKYFDNDEVKVDAIIKILVSTIDNKIESTMIDTELGLDEKTSSVMALVELSEAIKK